MGKLLLVVFTVVPLLELYLLVLLGGVMGFGGTVALVLATGLLGAWLAKRAGLQVLRQWRQALAEMRMPEEGVLGGVLVLLGGALLITPGVLTDVVGLLLLIPPTRRLVVQRMRPWVQRKIDQGTVRVVSVGSVEGFGVRTWSSGRRGGAPVRPKVVRRGERGVIEAEAEIVGEDEIRPPER